MSRAKRRLLLTAGAVPLLVLTACQGLIHRQPDDCPDDVASHTAYREPHVRHAPSLMSLAGDLDHLEKHIDWYGSVVAKSPDVWGQARLTQHRDEFEREMAKDLGRFEANLQGALSRADQSFAQQSVALAAAVSTEVATTRIPAGVVSTAPTTPQTTTQQVQVNPIALGNTDFPALVTSTGTAGSSEFFAGFTPPGAKIVGFSKEGTAPPTLSIGLEPTLQLAQKKRYLDFLNQLRRENEGDDTADSPGYSLNVVRLPVSVLPGKKTDEGHGAEVTFTITPVLGADLLPSTFRNLVGNDLRQQLGFPLTQVLGAQELASGLLTEENKQISEGTDIILRWVNLKDDDSGGLKKNLLTLLGETSALSDQDKKRVRAATKSFIDEGYSWPTDASKQDDAYADALVLLIRQFKKQQNLSGHKLGCDSPLPPITDAKTAGSSNPNLKLKTEVRGFARMTTRENSDRQPDIRLAITQKLVPPVISFSNGLNNKLAFPPSQIYDVIGDGFAFEIAFGAWRSLRTSIERQGYAHLPDVQSYLQEEIRAAQQFLAVPENHHLWDKYCTEELVTAIRSRQVARLQNLREEFRCEVERLTETDKYRLSRPDNDPMGLSTTTALAWCVIVDSALLTDRLVRDMKETATSKNRAPAECRWLPYFLPDPPQEARQAFNAYVQLRWPIHVFALDPSSQDQNLADSLLTRRETQLALSMAFTSGRINARTLTRYARRLEAQYDTIALNRTQVGFAHGEDTFGWRFYPRFQTPDTEGNLTTLVRDQLIGGPSRDALLRQRRLEPGPRECVAVVLMPSFVPNVTIDSVSNWFALTNPKHKTLDHTQALRLSRTVQSMKTCGPNARDACEYRDGEFERMLRRIGQLEARLPTQTQTVPVPVLNTLGGFEMFSNGTTDLAPELYGWYGAPGVDSGKATTLFLVGDHFSPLRTRVIVGNKEVADDKRKMLSRQVMQVEVSNDQVVLVDSTDRSKRYVQAHIATPYGVTRELIIPVVTSDAVTPDGYHLTNENRTLAMTYKRTDAEDKKTYTIELTDVTRPITFRGVFATGAQPKIAKIEFQFGADVTTIAINFPADKLLLPDAKGTYTILSDKLKEMATELVKNRFPNAQQATVDPVSRMPLSAVLRVTPFDDKATQGVPTKVTGTIDLVFKPK